MIPQTSLRNSFATPELLGGALAGDSWHVWRTLGIAAMGEKLTDQERAIFRAFTGRTREPGVMVEEFVAVKGRRAGASHFSGAGLCPYIAGLCKHPALARGERGVLLVVAQDQRTADGILDFAEAAFRSSPVLRQLVETRNARELILNNGVTIEVRASDFRRLRGLTFIAAICDEVAFWMNAEGAANPDDEILNAIRPGLATTGGPLFLLSSPYARRGVLWQTYQEHYGPQGDPRILVAHGTTLDFNPSFPVAVIDRALERDPAAASAEYLGLFRVDVETFVAREAVEACMPSGVFERAPQPGLRYIGFVDPSAGISNSFTLAISHKDVDSLFLDLIREVRPPFSPEAVCAEFASICQSYRIGTIYGDRYAGLWPVEQFRKYGVRYEQSAKPKSEIYLSALSLLNSRRVELLDHPRLVNQLISLERRTARGGKDSIDHAPHQHDDLANASCGALLTALYSAQRRLRMVIGILPYVPRDGGDPRGYEVDPLTLEPINQPPPLRIRQVFVNETEAPAARGWA